MCWRLNRVEINFKETKEMEALSNDPVMQGHFSLDLMRLHVSF